MSSESPKQPSVGELADEFLERYRRGERPALSEYTERYPEYADEIRDVFPGLAMIEDLGPELPDAGVLPPDTVPELSTDQLGDFRIIREVGRGGMGVVYEAEQVSLGRRVALKVLPRQLWQDGRHARRFEREARAAARLHHTNIVPVFGVGEQDGLHYYVMQFIQGLSLDDVLVELQRVKESSAECPVLSVPRQAAGARRDVSAAAVAQSLVSGRFEHTLLVDSDEDDQPSPHSTLDTQHSAPPTHSTLNAQRSTLNSPSTVVGQLSDTFPGHSVHTSKHQSRQIYWQSVARIGVQAAEALEYAHDQEVVHRDVKPSNLLLDTRGTIWITDFGLAKAADQQDLTHTGDVLGTLRYMAPEQFDGKADARSDVYSLGLTLYELLALQPAFGETDRYRLVKQVTHGTPARLRTLDPSIPRDLETIVHKAIDRDASHRYQSARELAEDLQRYLGDEPIRARRISPVARVRRWCKRNPAGATVAALLLIGFLSSCAAAAVFLQQAAENARLAETERELKQQAQDALAEAKRERARADENFAQAWSAVDNFYATVSQSRLLNVPGMQPLRRELLTEALDYYRQFIEQESGSSDLQKELADAQLGLARISRELGLPEQREAFRDALTMYRDLSRASPDDAEIQHGLATCYFWLGSNLQAIDIWDRLLERDPENAVYGKHLGDALNSLAYRQDEEQNYEAALVTHQRALYLRMDLLRADPDDPQLHSDLGSTLNNIGVLLYRKERYEEALAMYHQSAEHDEFAFARDPGNIQFGRFSGTCARNIAYLEEYFGRSDEAERWFRRAAEVRARIASANPDVAYLQSDAYEAWRLLAEHLKEHGQPDEAADAFRRAGDVLERLPQRTPDELFNLARVYALASATGSQSDGAADEPTPEQLAERRQLADRAVDSLQRAVDAGFREAERLETDEDLAALRMRSDFAELLARVETLSEFEQTRPIDPETGDERDEREDEAAAQYSIGLLKTLFDESDEALAALTRSAELREELLESRPHDGALRTHLAETHRALADLAWRNDRFADGREHFDDVLRVLEAGEPEWANQQLSDTWYDLGDALARRGLFDESLPCLTKWFELDTQPDGNQLRRLCVNRLITTHDRAAYEFAAQAVNRLSDSSQTAAYGSAIVLPLLRPEHLDNNTIEHLSSLAKEVWDAHPTQRWARRAYGLASYRGGEFELALEVLPEPGPDPVLAQCGFVRAMALYRLERLEAAQLELDRTLQYLHDSDRNVYRPDGSGDLGNTWHRWVTADELRQEAETVILGAARPPRALVSLHRAKSHALYGDIERAEELFAAAIRADPESGFNRVLRVRFLAEAGLVKRAMAEFPRARELFLSEQEEGARTPDVWQQVGITARLCGEQRVAADAFATAVQQQSELLRDSPVDAQLRTRLDGMFDNLAAELTRLDADDELRAARSQRRELYETLAINPLTAIGGHAAPYVWSVAVLPDGRRALSAGQDGNVCLWDLETGEEIRRYEHHGPVLKVACLPGGEQFLTAGYDTMIRLWDVESGEIVREFRGHTDHVNSLAVSPDGARAISAGEDEALRVWDVVTGDLLRSVATDGSMRCVAISRDGRRTLSGPFLAEDYAVSLWDVETGEKVRDFAAHESTVYCVSFSADARRAVSGDQNGLVVLWDLESGQELQRWNGNWGEARDATILDDRRILLATGSGVLALLDVETGRVIQRVDGTVRHYDLAILPNGRQVATSDADAKLRLWSLPLLAPPDEAAQLIARQFDALAPAPQAQERLLDQIRNSTPVMDRLIELRPDEPQVEIARAKVIAEHGEWDAAAATLQPVLSPEAIVETDWWISPNYPGDTHRRWSFFSAEDNLDPYTVHGASEDSPWQLSWRPAGAGSDGWLTLLTNTTEHSGTYVLRRIYAPQPCTRLFLTKADNTSFFWLNGQLLDVANTALAVPVPVELDLETGWNTLLVKVINFAGSSGFEMRHVVDMSTPDSQRLLIQAAVLRGDWQLAVQRWQELTAIEGEATDLAAWKAVTDIHIERTNLEQQQMLLEALYACHTGDNSTASQLYRDAVAVNAHTFLKHPRLADLRSTLEELLGVEQQLTEAIEQQPDSPERWRDRALFHLRRSEHEQSLADFQHAIECKPPRSVEPGWTLSRTTILPGASSAHFSPRDGAIYAGTRFGGSANGVHRIDANGGINFLAETPAVMGLVVDPENGDVFISDSQSNLIHRLEGGTGRAEVWVSTFNSADSDPMGMAIVPAQFAGNRIAAGDLLVVDGGFSGDDEIYAISTRQSHRVTRLHRDGEGFGPLTQATDVTVGKDGIYLTDAGNNAPGQIYRLEQDGRLTPVPTAEEIPQPVAVAADPLTGDLLVLDVNRKAVLGVNPTTGAVSTCIANLNVTWDSVAGLDVSPDGTQLLIADHGASAVFTFTRTALGLAQQSVRPLLRAGRWDEAAELLDAALDEETKPFVVQSDWWVTGPYPQIGFDASHFSPADNLDPLQAAAGSGAGAVLPEWRTAEPDANGRLDFNSLFAGSAVQSADGYALRRIYASDDQTVLYHFDADDRMQLWVNGQSAGLADTSSHDVPVQVPLKQGWNTLLVKVWNAYGNYFLAANEVRREEVSPVEWNRLIHRAANVLDPRKVIEQLTADIAASPEDPGLLIQRGRWYLRVREYSEADADFAAAAALTPDELNRFLEAGWWVIGPYPPELREFCPPELDPDPSQPVRVIDPQTGLSDRPVAWQSVPTGEMGRIDLSSLATAGQEASFYALTHVCSPDERTTALCVSSTKEVRIWVNGDLVRHTPSNGGDWTFAPERVPIALQPGRNSILVKTFPNSNLTIRMGDHPYDRGMELTHYGLWKDAAGLVEAGLQRSSVFHEYPYRSLAAFQVAAGDIDALHRLVASLAGRYGSTGDPNQQFGLAIIGGMAPDLLNDSRQLIACAEAVHTSGEPWQRFVLPLAYYRAGHWQDVVDYFTEDAEARQVMPEAAPLLSMAHDRLHNDTEAAEYLDTSIRQFRQRLLNSAPRASWVAWYYVLTREACLLITGSAQPVDDAFAEYNEQRRSAREQFRPDVAEFDAAIYNAPEMPHLYVSRGMRLAELGRFDEAEADFNKAVELAPDDVDALLARGRFHARQGNVDAAREDFQTALDIGRADYLNVGRAVERQIALHEEVLEEALRAAPGSYLWRIRSERELTQGKWEEAVQSLLSGGPHWSHQIRLGPLAWLIDDEDVYRQSVEMLDEQIESFDNPEDWQSPRILLRALRPVEGEDAVELERLVEVESARASPHRWDQYRLGLGLYRLGRYEEALESLTHSLRPENRWQTDAPVWPVLAMTHWQLGNHDEARKWLDRCAWWVELAQQAADVPHAVGAYSLSYDEWLCAHLFYCEAAALIGAEPPVPEGAQTVDYSEAAGVPATIRSMARVIVRMNAELGAWDRAADWSLALGQLDEAIEYAAKGLEAQPDEPLPEWRSSPLYQGLFEKLDNRDDVFERLVALRPDDDLLWIERARYLAGRDEWERAAEHYEHAKAVEQGGNRQREYLCALVMSGRRDEYDAFCRELLENRSDESLNFSTCWGCALLPNPQIDPARLIGAIQADTRFRGQAHFSAALAVANIAAGQPEPAIVYAEEAVKAGEYRPAAAFILAIAHHRLGRFEESREWYTQGMDALNVLPNPEGAILIRFWAKLLQREALRELEPGDPTQPDAEPWYTHVVLLLEAGDTQAYLEFCEQLLELHGDTADPTTAGLVAWIATIAPGAVADPEQLVRLAEQQVQADPAAIHLYKLGTALYRAGRYEEALDTLNETVQVRGNGGAIWDWLFLAMTYDRLGHPGEAREALAASIDRLDDPATQLKWHEAIDLRMLRREAEELLSTDASGSESRDSGESM